MGFFSGITETGIKHFGHGGGSVGGISSLNIYPDQKLVMAIVTNDTRASFPHSHELAELFMEISEQ